MKIPHSKLLQKEYFLEGVLFTSKEALGERLFTSANYWGVPSSGEYLLTVTQVKNGKILFPRSTLFQKEYFLEGVLFTSKEALGERLFTSANYWGVNSSGEYLLTVKQVKNGKILFPRTTY